MQIKTILPLLLLLTLPVLIGAGRDSYRDPYARESSLSAGRVAKKPKVLYAVRSSEERTRSKGSGYGSRLKSSEELLPFREEKEEGEEEEERDYEEEEEAPRSFRKPSPVYERPGSMERPGNGYGSSSSAGNKQRYSAGRATSELLSPERPTSARYSSERLSPERVSSERYSSARTASERERFSPERSSSQRYTSTRDSFEERSPKTEKSNFRASPIDDFGSMESLTKSKDCLQTQLLTALTENKMLLKQQQQQQQQRQQQQQQQMTRQQFWPVSTYPMQRFPLSQRSLPSPHMFVTRCPNSIQTLTPEKTQLLNWVMKNGQHKALTRSTRSLPPEENRRGWVPLVPVNTTRTPRSSYYSSSSYSNNNQQRPQPQQYSLPIISPKPSFPRLEVPNYAVLDSEFVSVGDFQDATSIVNQLKQEFPPVEELTVPIIRGEEGREEDDYIEEDSTRATDYEEEGEEEEENLRGGVKHGKGGRIRFEEDDRERFGSTSRDEEENSPQRVQGTAQEDMSPQSYEEQTREELRKYKGGARYGGSSSRPQVSGYKTVSRPLPQESSYGTGSRPLPQESGYKTGSRPVPQRPRPQQSGYKTASRPLPQESSYSTGSRPLPEGSGYETASRPLPQESGYEAPSRPLPLRPGYKTASRPLPQESGYKTASRPLPEEKDTYSHQTGPNGNYNVEYSTGRIQSQERGYLKSIRTQTETRSSDREDEPEDGDSNSRGSVANVKIGSVSWTSPDGYTFHLTYEADENGYRPLLTQTSTLPSTNLKTIDPNTCWGIRDSQMILLPEEEWSSPQRS